MPIINANNSSNNSRLSSGNIIIIGVVIGIAILVIMLGTIFCILTKRFCFKWLKETKQKINLDDSSSP